MPVNTTLPRARFEPAREMNYADIDSVFTMIGSEFEANFGVLYVQNFTDKTIDFSISFDGADVTFSLAAGEKLATDMFTNNLEIARGEAAWCQYRDAAPTSGFVQVVLISPAV